MNRKQRVFAGFLSLGLFISVWLAGSAQGLKITTLMETLRLDLGLEYDGSAVASVSDFAVAPDGNIYICDSRGGRVLRFAADGKFMGAFGRPGQGPGDLQRPLSLVRSASGDIIVADGNLSVFSPNGRFLKRMSERPGSLVDAMFEAGPEGYFLSITRFRPSTNGVIMEKTVEKTDADFRSVRTLFRRSDEYGGKATGSAFFNFAPGPKGELYVLNRTSREYRILALDPEGNPRPDIVRPFRPVAKCPEDHEYEKKRLQALGARAAAIEGGSAPAVAVDPHKFAVGNITVDKTGRLWTTTCGSEPCDRSVYVDVFGPDGTWIKRFQLGSFSMPRIKVEGASLFVLDGDAAEDIVLVRYDLAAAGVFPASALAEDWVSGLTAEAPRTDVRGIREFQA